MMSSEVVHTRHHIRGFIHRSLVLKIKTEHWPDTRHHGQEGKKKNMAKSEGPNSGCNIEIFLEV